MAEATTQASAWMLYVQDVSKWFSEFHWDAHHWEPITIVGFLLLVCFAYIIVRYAFRLFLLMVIIMVLLYVSGVSPEFNQGVLAFFKPLLSH